MQRKRIKKFGATATMVDKDNPKNDEGGSGVREPRTPKPKDSSGGATIERQPPPRELILL
jgi:hypothetical protein